MKLQECLDELRNNILNDRRASTGDNDTLWSDDTLVRYINEACKRFARDAFVIRDSRTSEVVNVTVKQGVTEYDLHPAIISVISAKVDGAVTDLQRVGHTLLGQYTTQNSIILPELFTTTPPAAPMAFATDETLVEDDDGSVSVVSMRVFPTPRPEDDGTLIKLRTIRLPLDDLTTNNLSATPEIPADYHLDMLDWAAYLALRIVDDDAGNPKRSADFAASFEAHVAEARKLVLSKLYAPQRWGFGRNGWGGYCRG